jgi:hydrogenase maturation protease
MPRTLIVGYGNPLRGDDGVGIRAAERLRELIDDPEIEILALHQLTPELMDPLSRAARAIFIDACAGGTAGEVRERRVNPEPAAPAFTHFATPEALLAGARALYGSAAEGVIFTVAGADFDVSADLSPAVARGLEEVVEAVLRLLPPRFKQ